MTDPGLFEAKEGAPVEPARTDLVAEEIVRSARGPVTETDVLVIGGGIAGAAVAYYLAKEGVEVELLERAELNREASGTNAGSFHFQLAIHQLSGRGAEADRARLLSDARSSVEAYGLWTRLGAELDADLGLHQTGGWMVAETPEQLALLHEKHVLEEQAGIETEVLTGAALRDRAPYFSDRVLGATYCDLEGHANPLVTALLYARRAAEHGARVRTHSEVLAIDVDDASAAHRFTVHTTRGHDPRPPRRQLRRRLGGGASAAMVGLRFPIRREGLHVNVTESRSPLLPSMVQHIGRRLTLKQSTHGSFIIGGGWPTAVDRLSAALPDAVAAAPPATSGSPSTSCPRWRTCASCAPGRASSRSPTTCRPSSASPPSCPGYYACVATTGFTFSPIFARQVAEQHPRPPRHARPVPRTVLAGSRQRRAGLSRRIPSPHTRSAHA